jgi:hypothetical protein
MYSLIANFGKIKKNRKMYTYKNPNNFLQHDLNNGELTQSLVIQDSEYIN